MQDASQQAMSFDNFKRIYLHRLQNQCLYHFSYSNVLTVKAQLNNNQEYLTNNPKYHKHTLDIL